MPKTTSAKKTLKQSEKRRKRNIIRKKNVKKMVKKIRKLKETDNQKEALGLIPEVYKAIDKAVKRNIIKKNTANRKKSKLAKFVSRKTKQLTSVSKTTKNSKIPP